MVEELKYASISINEVMASKVRLEANVYNVEARKAKEILKNCRWDIIQLLGENGLVKSAFYPGRFKRIYVAKGEGYPMILPSQMSEIKPQATKHISEKTFNTIGNLKVEKETLLMTRSGTIGTCTLVTDWLEGVTMSDDIIRVKFKNSFDLGYVYAYLQTEIGRTILATNNYGSVIQHIEPEHLQNVEIPNPPENVKEKIHNLVIESFALRDKSNMLIDDAERILVDDLRLPPIEQIRPDFYDSEAEVRTFSVKVNSLHNRFDASYHNPIVSSILDYFFDHAERIEPLSKLCKKITMPGIFKRIYVDKNEGVAFLGTTDVRQLSPKIEKYLSKKAHKNIIEKELKLKQNTILQFNRGSVSVGEVVFVPAYFENENWTASQNCLRIVPISDEIAGYLYVFLNSEYGNALSRREIYGAVIDMIDPKNTAEIPIPVLKDKSKIEAINSLAIEANELRTRAYYLEKEAIDTMNNEVLFNSFGT